MMRLFAAIWLPDEVISGLPLPLLKERLDRQGVRFTRTDKIHLTLRFLGNVHESDLEKLVGSLAEKLAGLEATELRASGLGAFPDLRRPGVIWCGVLGDLDLIHERVVEATDGYAERADDKRFHPHLTLARVSPPSQKVGRALQPLLEQVGDQVFGCWTATEVLLVQSMPDGSYEARASFPLAESSG